MTSSAVLNLLSWLKAGVPDRVALDTRDWDELLQAAVAHTASVQLFERMRAEAAGTSLPADVVQCAWLAATRQKQQMASFERDLSSALGALAAAGMEPLVLKGAHLATVVYPNAAHRPMSDLDLMVPFDRLAAAEQALLDAGYATKRSVPVEVYCARSHQLPRLTAAGRMDIELHHTIAPPYSGIRTDIDGLWVRSVPKTILGQPARVLCPEDLLLHVCFHAGNLHLFGEKGLRPMLDVQAIVARFAGVLEWSAVVSRARQWGVSMSAFLLLKLCRSHLAVPVPDGALEALAPANLDPNIVATACAQLFELPGSRFEGSPEALGRSLVSRQARETTIMGLAAGEAPTTRGLMHRAARLASLVRDFVGGTLRNPRLPALAARRVHNAVVLQRWLDAEKNGAARRPAGADAGGI